MTNKEKEKSIWFKDVGKPFGYFILILIILLLSFGITRVFVKNPNKTPDLVITLLGGAVAGLIGFYAAKFAYKEQQGYEEKKQKRDMIIELQNEIEKNLVEGSFFSTNVTIPIEEMNYPVLTTLAWDNLTRTNYRNTILKNMTDDLGFLYLLIKKYNNLCVDFTFIKNRYNTSSLDATLSALRTQLKKYKENLDSHWRLAIKEELEECKQKLKKIIDSDESLK